LDAIGCNMRTAGICVDDVRDRKERRREDVYTLC